MASWCPGMRSAPDRPRAAQTERALGPQHGVQLSVLCWVKAQSLNSEAVLLQIVCRLGGGGPVLSPGLVRQMAAGAAARRPLWQLRAQMAHFIAHFTSYLQVRR